MTGQTIATAHWRALDRAGEDRCRLARVDHGWLLVGHARFRDDDGFAALDYVVRCDNDWHTLSADVAGWHDERQIKLVLHRDGDDWRMNDAPQPQVTGARDIDLAFTPATNLMPLRRLAEGPDSTIECCAAWLQYPGCELARLDQTYARTGSEQTVTYASTQTGYQTRLHADTSGFVTYYLDVWDGEVSYAPV